MQRCDVVVVGAGLAGLACATRLADRFDVMVLEASDAAGGRIRTDEVDGMLLDRGFQLLNPAYPVLKDVIDVDALDLQSFEAGVVVASGGTRTVIADPLRSPLDVGGVFGAAAGGWGEKLRAARYLSRLALGDGSSLKGRPDVPYGQALAEAGIDGRLRTTVLEPFLAGVLAEDAQESSRVFVDLLLRMFVRGTPALPAGGMQRLPEQLAVALPPGVLRVGHAVQTVSRADGSLRVDAGEVSVSAPTVVLAADPVTSCELAGLPAPTMRGLTTFYHRAGASPVSRRFLHVDGDRRGPVVNSAVVSDVAPAYCGSGALIASTVLGARDDAATEAEVRAQLARVYGVATDDWELVRAYAIPAALPAMLPPLQLRQPVDLGDGLFVAGDHRDTASIQGALVSGLRTAREVSARLGAAAA